MDENLALIAIAMIVGPAYALIMSGVVYVYIFGFYQARKLDQSADETAITEKSNPVLVPGTTSSQSNQTK